MRIRMKGKGDCYILYFMIHLCNYAMNVSKYRCVATSTGDMDRNVGRCSGMRRGRCNVSV